MVLAFFEYSSWRLKKFHQYWCFKQRCFKNMTFFLSVIVGLDIVNNLSSVLYKDVLKIWCFF